MFLVHDLCSCRQRGWSLLERAQPLALHNAAHAVAGELLDVPYGAIGLADPARPHLDPRQVNCHIADRLDDFGLAWPFARHTSMMLLAGDVAVGLALGGRCVASRRLANSMTDWLHRVGDPEDFDPDIAAAFSTVEIMADNTEMAIRKVIVATIRVVEANVEPIMLLADELEKRHRMCAAEVQSLIGGKVAVVDAALVEGGDHVA